MFRVRCNFSYISLFFITMKREPCQYQLLTPSCMVPLNFVTKIDCSIVVVVVIIVSKIDERRTDRVNISLSGTGRAAFMSIKRKSCSSGTGR